MGSWVAVAVMSAVMSPEVLAERQEIECQVEVTRRASSQRLEPSAAPNAAAPVAAPREESEAPVRSVLAERRRNGKPIPDAELIGRRRVL